MPNERSLSKKVVSATELAECLGVTDRWIRKLRDDGFIQQVDGRGYRLGEAIRGYARSLGTKKSATRDSEHSRLARAQAVKIEMENLRRRGELLPADMVFETLQAIAVWQNQQPAARAGRLANELAHQEPAIIRDRIITDGAVELADAQALLQARAAALEAAPEGGDDLDASEEAHAGAVGRREPDLPAGEPGAGEIPQSAHAVLHSDPGVLRGPALSARGRGDGYADG
jgi:biotin operon repressor